MCQGKGNCFYSEKNLLYTTFRLYCPMVVFRKDGLNTKERTGVNVGLGDGVG